MQSSPRPTNVLAIESAVAGGSMALVCRSNETILYREGNDSSRAEKMLSIIAGLLNEGGLSLRDLDLIAVSTGPGSYSGIRIGLSTALGLARSVGVQCVGVSVLDAMAYSAPKDGSLAVAVPVGKNDVAYQVFRAAVPDSPLGYGDPELRSLSKFGADLSDFPGGLFAPQELIERLGNGHDYTGTEMIRAESSLAVYVAKYALTVDPKVEPISPIYLRNKDASRPGAF